MRLPLGCLALAAAALPAALSAQDLAAARALEAAMQAAIARVEPAVACVLVSRSPAYRELGVGGGPTPDNPGRLGEYDRLLAERRAGTDERLRRLVEELDLARPKAVPDFYGSGVVVDAEQGLVLTNFHVVRDATRVFVRLPGRHGSWADIHAADARADLAVLRLIQVPAGLVALRPGHPPPSVKKGTMVLSLANPYAAGFIDGSPSASWGIISNIRRRAPAGGNEQDRVKTLHHYGTLLQTDARLNLGCSGGALVDLNGRLVGLTTSLAAVNGSETAGGYAVPMDAALSRVVRTLVRGEEVEYGFLGVGFDDTVLGTGSGATPGVRLRRVTLNSPGDKAGLQVGDMVLEVNGTEVRDLDDLFLAIGSLMAGDEVRVVAETLNRGRRTITARLAKLHHGLPLIASRRPPAVYGLRVDWPRLVELPNRESSLPEGVVVREVLPNTPADRAGLRPGDVIEAVNGESVDSPAGFAGKVKGAPTLRLRLGGEAGREVKLP
jgi:serine protease Do